MAVFLHYYYPTVYMVNDCAKSRKVHLTDFFDDRQVRKVRFFCLTFV